MAQTTTTKETLVASWPEAPATPEVPTGLHIGGVFRDASDGATSPVIDPARNIEVARVAKGTVDDAKAAIEAAEAAFQDPTWRDMDPTKRGKLLLKTADQLKKRFADVALIESLQMGKTVREAQGDVAFVLNTLTYFAGLADKIQGETIPVGPGRLDYTLKEPLGVTTHVAPWNYPLLLSVRSVAPALAAGNTVVLKPASWTPLSCLMLAEAGQAAGLPPGVLNVVPGPGGAVGNTLVSDRRVESVNFTGSCAVGQTVMEAAAKTTKRTVLELGGKSPVVVFEDVDPAKTAKGIGWGIFANAGQMCWAGSRLIVHEQVADAVLDGLKGFIAKHRVGPAWSEEARMGPVAHKDHLESVTGHIESGKDEGATLFAGGGRITEGPYANGNFVEPTVFTGVTPDMTIWKEEIFGPVLTVTTFTDEEEAVRLANETTFGLWSGVWTRDLSRAHRVAGRIEAGMVGINEGPVTFPQTPFGGYKQSGLGVEQGVAAVDAYTRTKNVMVRL
ncbi:MAG: aldehyde dehydrogenase family protein [Euryarchaeota archaeon]|nr:aldehyde dehydrogenase family protein [Euryarchaeota archaeon]